MTILFRFLLSSTEHLDYTPAADFVAPALHADVIEFEIPRDNRIAALDTPIGLIVSDLDGDRQTVVWTGTVTAIEPKSSLTAAVRCESPAARLRNRPFDV